MWIDLDYFTVTKAEIEYHQSAGYVDIHIEALAQLTSKEFSEMVEKENNENNIKLRGLLGG